jgi:hypothetical protein
MKNTYFLKILFSSVLFLLFYLNNLNAQLATTTFNYTGSIVSFTVPAGVTRIDMEAYGAQGGDGSIYGTSLSGGGGRGAYIKGTVSVTPGEVLRILVGQKGGSSGGPHGNENGGGGGSFVVRQTGTVPLIVAGGGGGAPATSYGTACSRSLSNAHGQTSTSGSSVSCFSSAAGGTSGGGGASAGSYQGGGGGGFSSNGANGGTHCRTATGGMSFTNGGAGGVGNNCYHSSSYGGFGGGGGGQLGGPGGGGGYSGGASAGGWSGYSTYGGGGGSYNSGTNQTNTSGVRTGNGVVIFSYYPCTQNSNLALTPNFIFRGNMSATDANGYTCYCDSVGKLLLALKLGSSGAVITPNQVRLKIRNSEAFTSLSSGGIISNADGYSLFNKRWDVSPTTQPSSNVEVRYFFNQTDFDSLKAALSRMPNPSSITSITELNMYKATSGAPFADPHTVNGILLNHSTSSSLTSWRDSSLGGGKFFAQFKVSSFSGGGAGFGGGGSALPVNLIKFDVLEMNDDILLFWQINPDKTIKHFEIERQFIDSSWQSIAQNKNIGEINEYLDNGTISKAKQHNIKYISYRLKYVYFNNNVEYSEIKTIDLYQQNPINIFIYPQPASETLTILNTNPRYQYKIELFTLLGKKIFSQSNLFEKTNVDISKFESGIYFIQITQNGKTYNQKIRID